MRGVIGGLVALVVWLAMPGIASADRPFGARFSTNTQGEITIASNAIETCLDALPVCPSVRDAAGGAVSGNNNNSRTMTWIDVDSDPATFDSSSADLSLPTGAGVLFAGLYYGGRLTAGSGGSPAPSPGARNTVLLNAPGDSGYQALTASQVDDSSTQYQGFVDVTSIVAAAGAGTYTTANVQLGTGLSDSSSGGWALVVAYGDPAAPSRNLSVFDGLQNVSSSGNVTIPLSGFQTPLTGPVTSTVGIVAYEGDLGTTGDGAQIRNAAGAFQTLGNAINPGSDTVASRNNVFNSTISDDGAFVTSRTPSFQNNLGYDADLFRTSGVLGNGQTSTQVRLTTTGDAYQPGVVTIATDLFAPQITAVKTVDQPTAPLGGTLTYTVALGNTGQDAAAGTTFSDPLPPGTVFVPGSIEVGGTPATDAPGDDLAEFAAGRVVARLGAGATAAAGGSLAPGANSSVRFQVTVVTAGLPLGATIDNTADVAFRAATTGAASTVTSAPATTQVLAPDLTIGKSHSPALSPGAPSTYTLTVGNVGDGPSTGTVTVTDTLETGLTLNGAVTGTGWTCSTAGPSVTCTRTDALAAGSDYPPIAIPVLVSGSAQPGQLSNTASLASASDGNPDNDAYTDAGAVSEPAINLHVEKAVTSTPSITPAGYVPGDVITYRIEVTNTGVADAANVQLDELLDAPLTVQSIDATQGSCAGTTCNLGTIASGQAPVTITVNATLPDFAGGYPSDARLVNTATVSAPVGNEVDPDDNTATAAVATLPFSDISLTKSFSPAQPVAGGLVTFTLDVHSDGPGTVDAFIGDRLPLVLQNPTATITGGTGVCRYDPTGESLGAPPGSIFPIIACDVPQFGPGQDRVVTVQGTLAPESAGQDVENFAFASAVVPFTDLTWDPDNFADNTDTVNFTPGTVDLGVSKRLVSAATVAVGDVATFALTATNAGTVAADNAVLTDALPAGLEPVDLPAGCVAAGQDVACALGTLAPGAEQTIELRARATATAAGTTITNSASIRSDQADIADGDNVAAADVTVAPLPPVEPPPVTPVDLAVTVAPHAGLATVGTAGTWRLRITNHGPGTATNVALTGAVRGKARVVGAELKAVACLTGGQIRCGLGTLAPGASRIVTAELRPTAAGTLTLSGAVTAAEPDTVPPERHR